MNEDLCSVLPFFRRTYPPLREGVIALFPGRRTVSLSEYGYLQGAPFGGMLEVSSNHHSLASGAPLWFILHRQRSC